MILSCIYPNFNKPMLLRVICFYWIVYECTLLSANLNHNVYKIHYSCIKFIDQSRFGNKILDDLRYLENMVPNKIGYIEK
ncbi:hypothetical protein MHIR_DE00203 [Candidatus Doolittlea endobia]|uniref:Uncharacterized protein n=1 Tax=Candidatus Doolittlea endobia TaxID=1778262 RepID=A0A143WS32_9ENTR|nr:hypothetical protein MHIR_DE00203 [Candidatus Doolittlea endobia]